MKHLISTLSLVLFTVMAFGQGGQITSIYVVPQNPTVDDEVTVYADLTFNNSGCPLDYQAFALQNTTFAATAHHCVGLLTAICNTTDTFELGQLAAGPYTFDLTLTSGAGGPNCSPGIIPDDNDQIQFSVSLSTGIEELESLEDFIYPNPFSDQLTFKSALPQSATITDLNGRLIFELDAGSTRVDLEHLPRGVYLFRIGKKVHKLVKE